MSGGVPSNTAIPPTEVKGVAMYLDSGSVPEPTLPLCPLPQPARYNGTTGWPDSRKMGWSDPTRKMNARILDSDGWGLIRSRGLWYVPVQAKRPFIIPIPQWIWPFLKTQG